MPTPESVLRKAEARRGNLRRLAGDPDAKAARAAKRTADKKKKRAKAAARLGIKPKRRKKGESGKKLLDALFLEN
jgi:hypothetical protein